MKLRIARKIAPTRRRGGDKRPWWSVYTDEQLQRAERRLRTSWRRVCPLHPDGSRSVSSDFFAANRVDARRIQQQALRRHRRQQARST